VANFETILFEQQRRGVLITLNRPTALNAMNRLLKDELQAALELAKDDEEIRAVVITGAGASFSTGDDMSESVTGLTAWPYGIHRTTRWWTSMMGCVTARVERK
jgi:enoyl-CoA hydratase/carnithine racemase